ncbi:MAG: site-specific integrase [Polyangiaceae bacterium]
MPKASKYGVQGLYKVGDRWHIDLRWRDPHSGRPERHRERLSRGVSSAAAKERVRLILNAGKSGTYDALKAPLPTLRAAFDEYGKVLDTNFPKYAKKRRAALNRMLNGIGDKGIDQVSPIDVERYKHTRLASRSAKPRKPATVNRDLELLMTFVGWSVSALGLPEQNAKNLRAVKKLRQQNERVRSLTEEEEAKLLGELNVWAGRITRVALLTGMRQGELLKLPKAAVNLAHGSLLLTDTKNGDPRTVYLNTEALAIVREAMGASRCDSVFTSRTGKPYSGDGFRAVFHRAIERAGIEDFRFHDTRHTTATRLRRADVGIDVVSRALGHRSIRMSMRYAHIEPGAMHKAMSSLPALSTPVAPKKGAKSAAAVG